MEKDPRRTESFWGISRERYELQRWLGDRKVNEEKRRLEAEEYVEEANIIKLLLAQEEQHKERDEETISWERMEL